MTPATVGDARSRQAGAPDACEHRGFAPVTKYVNFDKGLEQELDVKLAASADDGAGSDSGDGEKVGRDHARVADTCDAASEEGGGRGEERRAREGEGGAESRVVVERAGLPGRQHQPWAKVIIDGKDTGKTTPIAPRSKIPLKAGKHVVTFVANGKKFNFDVIIKAGEDTRLIKQLTDSGM